MAYRRRPARVRPRLVVRPGARRRTYRGARRPAAYRTYRNSMVRRTAYRWRPTSIRSRNVRNYGTGLRGRRVGSYDPLKARGPLNVTPSFGNYSLMETSLRVVPQNEGVLYGNAANNVRYIMLSWSSSASRCAMWGWDGGTPPVETNIPFNNDIPQMEATSGIQQFRAMRLAMRLQCTESADTAVGSITVAELTSPFDLNSLLPSNSTLDGLLDTHPRRQEFTLQQCCKGINFVCRPNSRAMMEQWHDANYPMLSAWGQIQYGLKKLPLTAWLIRFNCEGKSFVPNIYSQDALRFEPGTVGHSLMRTDAQRGAVINRMYSGMTPAGRAAVIQGAAAEYNVLAAGGG